MKSYSDHTTTPINDAISELDAKQTAELTVLSAKLAKYKIAFSILAASQVLDLVAQLWRSLS